MKLLILADGEVGARITRWLLSAHPEDVAAVFTTERNAIQRLAESAGKPCFMFTTTADACSRIDALGLSPDLGVLAWWPKIVKPELLAKPRHGFINTHPSLLPNNRGKHYNFWALVEQCAFGVSLHCVDDGIDTGDIVAQTPIAVDWLDTGGTLYQKAQDAMVTLFESSYPEIRTLRFPRTPQDLSRGSFHLSREIEAASRIDLDGNYRARDLLNLLRARTFAGKPAAWFADCGEEFEARIEITRKQTDDT